ncbi:MAG: response regulator [Candidatus Omnitrophica bacterium]|nr:response regulator [Candidatus Omnitrophota bacterium]
MKVLIVDVSSMVRMKIRSHLKDFDFGLEDAENGRVAVDKVLADPEIKVVLLDWNMPEMDGHEALLEMRRHRDNDDLKIVMQTTENEMMQVLKALNAGADEYLMKPFDEQMLVDKLMLAMGGELPVK